MAEAVHTVFSIFSALFAAAAHATSVTIPPIVC